MDGVETLYVVMQSTVYSCLNKMVVNKLNEAGIDLAPDGVLVSEPNVGQQTHEAEFDSAPVLSHAKRQGPT